MASSDSEQHINSLPNYVLQEIFSYLPLDDRKTVSKVCRRWGQEAFAFRLLANVRLRISCHKMFSWTTTVSVLRNSSREYRNIAFTVCGAGMCSNDEYAFIVDVLDQMGTTIEAFTMKRGCSAMQLKGFADRMPNLKRMTVYVAEPEMLPVERVEFPVLKCLQALNMEIGKDDIIKCDQFDVLRMAPNLQRLSVVFSGCNEHVRAFGMLKAYEYQLRLLDLSFCFYPLPIDKLRFENLEVLKLRELPQRLNGDALHLMLRGLRELKAAHLGFSITKPTLEVICNSCPKLTTLDIRADGLEVGSFKYLSDLQNLQIFMVNDLKVELLDVSEPINGVKTLHHHAVNAYLDYEAYADTLFKIFPNVSNMEIRYRGRRIRIVDRMMARLICRKFVNLAKLTLGGEFCPAVTVGGFDHPGDLGNVEELHCVKASINVKPSSENNIKRLILDIVDPVNVSHIKSSFPKLQYLEMRSCKEISPETMAEIRRKIPNCVIHYVQRKLLGYC